MNKQTLILIVIAIILFMPTGHSIPKFVIDQFELASAEGSVAYAIAAMPKEVPSVPAPPITTCDKCNGTKMVKSGDGLATVPCPCGANCKCAGAMPTKAAKLTKKLVLVTAPSWCAPCIQQDRNTIPALKANGWKISEGKPSLNIGEAHIEVLNVVQITDEIAPFIPKTMEVPTWFLVENGKIVAEHSGTLNGYGVGAFWNKEKITNKHTQIIPYEGK